jgi:aerobic-type carbon monoxide dehydrogenase small subunit (CoxS/CutS family)
MVQLNINGRDMQVDADPGTYQRIRAAIKDAASTLA